MMRVLVVGAGLAGCVAAYELAENGIRVTMLDTATRIGGKVRRYGCKATDKCNNCGLCLTAGLWDKVEGHHNIDIHLSTKLIDLIQEDGKYIAVLKSLLKAPTFAAFGTTMAIEGFDKVIISTGFKFSSARDDFQEDSSQGRNQFGVITGSQIEAVLENRTTSGLFEVPPTSIAFIQCYGSRDCHEHTMYCSRVCCSYATRTAKVIKYFYPECRVVFFYMEMQTVNRGDYFQSLLDIGIEFIKCRPTDITNGKPAWVTYDDLSLGKRVREAFDLVVLSEGIKPNPQVRHISEICGLSQDKAGFLRYITTDSTAISSDILLIGCAGGPKNIAETYMESITLAKGILQSREALV